ncbi:protein translocase subunit SecF [Candidatus Peregrinibacteria bacterium]|nr:protein translocase subunit SecF [Candidatus Peregrinibacteria bacterium]MBI3816733.1 protein translocase subunit SecF [Candidatus Peregrinibacteria bacterium]
MPFLKLARIFLTLSGLLLLGSILLLIAVEPRLSIEFTGGTLMEVRIPGKTKADLETLLKQYKPSGDQLGNVAVSAITGVNGSSLLLRMRPLTNEEHVALFSAITQKFGKETKELQFTTIGPSVSASLKQKALIALAIASLAIIVYLAFAFRKLPKKLNPWKFGVLAVLAFIHDVLITAGIFVVVSRVSSFEFDPLFVTALLTILAYSANDTIVIFDRIRANLFVETREDFATTVARGLRQSVTRTVNTTMAALIMLFALFFLGSESIHWFMLALIVGTIIGTYSSYFIAAPLLIYWR